MTARSNPLMFLQNSRSGGNTLAELMVEALGGDYFKLGWDFETHNEYGDFRDDAKARIRRLYLGHFCFGAGRHVRGGVTYFASFRQSATRLLSGYNAYSGQTVEFGRWLEQEGAWEADNSITRRLRGIGLLNAKPYDFVTDQEIGENYRVTEEDFQQARHTLEYHLGFCFFQERYFESLVLMEESFHLPHLFSFSKVHKNQSHGMTLDQCSPEVLEQVREKNRYDDALYEMARQGFEARLATVSDATRRKIEIRKILHDILFDRTGQPVPTDQLAGWIGERINSGINGLLFADRVDDAADIICLLLAHPLMTPEFADGLLGAARNVFAIPHLEKIESCWHGAPVPPVAAAAG